jgi:hypothetical protein
MKIIAWIGAGFMFLSAALYVYVTWFYHFHQNPLTPVMDLSFLLPMPFAIIATPLILLGGLIGRPKYYWLVSLFAGIIFFLVFYPILQNDITNLKQTAPAYRDFSHFYKDAVFCWIF